MIYNILHGLGLITSICAIRYELYDLAACMLLTLITHSVWRLQDRVSKMKQVD